METKEKPSSFIGLSIDEIETHLRIDRYGDFWLSDAIRPDYNLGVVPSAGYRKDFYYNEKIGTKIPVIMAAASREKLIDLFLDLLNCLPNEVEIALDASYDTLPENTNFFAADVDLPVLKSWINDFEDVLLDDGCAGLGVFDSDIPMEVQLDEHKLIIIHANNVLPFESILRRHSVEHKPDIKFINEAEHIHVSSDELEVRFNLFRELLGAEL